MNLGRFQEAAADPFAPRILISGVRAAYVGPGLNLAPHRNATATVAVGLERPFLYTVLRGASAVPEETSWAVIPPDTEHHLRPAGATAFVYLDAAGDDYQALRALTDPDRAAGSVRAALDAAQRDGGTSAGAELRQILGAMGVRARDGVDPRIDRVVQKLARGPEDYPSVGRAAADAGLSTSRFQHVFRDAVGVPFRRYRMWARMGRVAGVLSTGGNLTEAALEAGFSSSAHFSAAFRTMFGLSPTQLLASGVDLRVDPAG